MYTYIVSNILGMQKKTILFMINTQIKMFKIIYRNKINTT